MSENLLVLFSLMIPGDSTKGLPSGEEMNELVDRIESGRLDQLISAAERIALKIFSERGRSIKQLDSKDFEAFVKSHRASIESDLRIVGNELLRSYYTDPRVQDAIGGSSQAPFPSGFKMPENNLDLLEVVFNRGPIYREVSNEQ